jgi:hypothetical protein
MEGTVKYLYIEKTPMKNAKNIINIVEPNIIVYDVDSYLFFSITTIDMITTVYNIIISEYTIINKN